MWNAPVPATTGELFIASRYNTDVVGNLNFLKTSVGGNGDLWTGRVTQIPQTFRGLRLRSHPDGDVSAFKTAILGLDEIVMNDGQRYIPPSSIFPIVGDITVSGAGGLDFGAEQTSTWYEIYVIGKSSTGSTADLRKLFHRAKDYFKDVSFETPFDTSNGLRVSTTANVKLGQSYKPITSGKVPFIDITLQRALNPVGNVWLTLEADVAGSPSGTPLAISDKFSMTLAASNVTYIRFPFRIPATVNAGTTYHIVLQGDYTFSATNLVVWGSVVAGGYANGNAETFNGTSWSAIGTQDFQFRAFVVRNDTAIVMPTGYDQICKVGYVYNNASGNFIAFNQLDKIVRRITGAGNAWGAITSTTPILIDLSAMLPPTPVEVYVSAFNNAITNSVVISGVPDGYQPLLVNQFDWGGQVLNSPGAGFWFSFLPIYTEFQAAYCSTSAGTASLATGGFRWF